MNKESLELDVLGDMPVSNQFRMGVLMYFRDVQGRLLLIKRKRRPNLGMWCAVGGKLSMPSGESPYECAQRETQEEVGLALNCESFDLRCILSEKNYENTGHWLMFVFSVSSRLLELPAAIDEGEFKFFEMSQLDALEMPSLDRRVLKEFVMNDRCSGVASLRVDEEQGIDSSKLIVEESNWI